MTIADLHIHSKYSRATSRDCDLAHLDLWARRKGIGLLGTGDFTHPAWRAELAEQLVPAEEGLYTLRGDLRLPAAVAGGEEQPRFVLSGEISSIYKKNGRVRKVHNVILLPSLEAAEELSHKLEAIGNIHSDGRPILGLDSRDLLEITLESCPSAVFIPAHIWTPHFSLFGAFSGFDAIEECFEDLTPHIHALETGLSSDPPMNWRVSALDGYTLVSHSDAHSPQKLGREADLLEIDLSYPALARALETGEGFLGTLEFFPEEGKYHLDGHRACGLCIPPSETVRLGGKCPVCGKKITIGVQHRVEELADRAEGVSRPGGKPFESIVPLPEVIAGSTGASPTGVRTLETYARLLSALGTEFTILRETPPEEIERVAGPCVAEGVRRLRRGQVERAPGYDGAYGTITLLNPYEIETINGQLSLFGMPAGKPKKPARRSAPKAKDALPKTAEEPNAAATEQLNPEQREAVEAVEEAVAVVAGPGTGKTKTLVARIAYLVEQRGATPESITAVTFTNQAAAEMRERLEQRLGRKGVRGMQIGTFHSICLRLLGDVTLIGEADALDIAAGLLSSRGLRSTPRALVQAVSRVKNGCSCEAVGLEEELFEAYNAALRGEGVLDFDDLLLQALSCAPEDKRAFTHLLVDEFQDINDVQYGLVRAWSREGESLFVIGDPDQSIYGFRGAGGRCFERLRADLPGLREIRLLQNYRSTPEILNCSLSVISHNPGGARLLHPNRGSDAPVRLLTAGSDFSEAIFIAKEIGRMAGGVDMVESDASPSGRTVFRSFSDIAVLCRTHRQAELIEKCLRHDSIPCVVAGREDFLSSDEARGALGFFRFLLDAGDLPSLRAALKFCWGCPADLIEQAESLCRSVSGPCDPASLRAALGDRTALLPWILAVEEYTPLVRREKPRKLLERFLGERTPSKPMERLLNMAVFHADMPSFLQNLLLGQEADLRRASGKDYASGAVRLMTLHGSKGLEFPVVFLPGVRAGNIPLERPDRPADQEEERRLFFVGMTRAREELILLTAPEGSAFLEELPAEGVVSGPISDHKRRPDAEQMSLF